MDSDSEDDVGSYQVEEHDAPPQSHQPTAEEQALGDLDWRMEARPPPGMRPTGRGQGSSNTGPKGVKADFEEAKRNLQNMKMRERLLNERNMQKAAYGEQRFYAPNPETKQAAQKNDDSDSDSDFSDDDEVIAKMRAERMQKIQALKSEMPEFGSFERISLNQFASLVKTTNPFTYTVCHLYENHNEACTRLNLIFEDLADQFPTVFFCRIRSTEAIPGYSEVGLPTLLIYKGGQMVKNLIRFTDLIPSIDDASVVRYLASLGVLQAPDKDISKQMASMGLKDTSKESDKPTSKFRRSNLTEQDDDDSD